MWILQKSIFVEYSRTSMVKSSIGFAAFIEYFLAN